MGKRWTREELAKAARQVAVSFGWGEDEVASDDELAAFARAWGVDVADKPPAKLLTSPMLEGLPSYEKFSATRFRVHDEAGKTWLIVDTCGNLPLLHDLIQAWYGRNQLGEAGLIAAGWHKIHDGYGKHVGWAPPGDDYCVVAP